MILIGAAFLVFWLLVSLFRLEVTTAALVTGAGFLLGGLVDGERFGAKRRP